MAIKGIFFDAADVFYERDESTNSVVKRLLTEHGYSDQLSAEDQARQQALYHQANGGLVTPDAYWNVVLKMYGVSIPEERAALIERILAQVNDIHTIPGGSEVLPALKQRGFLLGIITDTIYPLEWKMSWLERVGVAAFIDVVACSSTLGVHKPDPLIYLNAVHMANLAVAESAFVGHDAGELEGARQAGLATVAVLYDPHAQADHYANTLIELLDVPIFQAVH
jgi:FMN phosphatase YigB (HAD superfamily)